MLGLGLKAKFFGLALDNPYTARTRVSETSVGEDFVILICVILT